VRGLQERQSSVLSGDLTTNSVNIQEISNKESTSSASISNMYYTTSKLFEGRVDDMIYGGKPKAFRITWKEVMSHKQNSCYHTMSGSVCLFDGTKDIARDGDCYKIDI
jgi:hypothetical protein